MATETKNKKQNPDYRATAENLCNPLGVMKLLAELHKAQKTLEILEGYRPAKLERTIEITQRRISEINANIKDAIDAQGSYQDIEAGYYAVKYRRISKVYHVEPFKEHYPKFVPAVVVETINAKALEGVIKGGLIEEADLKMYKVITEDIGYAYVVR